MADQQIDLSAGVVSGNQPQPSSSGQPSSSIDLSAGVVNPPSAPPESIGEHVSNIGTNFAKGAEGTAAGVADFIHAIPGVGNKIIPDAGLASMHNQADTGVGTTADKVIGYGGETLMEFLLGDEAIKGLGVADKLLQSGKVAKLLQASPRLMEALKAGANLEKARGMLTPEALKAIEANPMLGRLVSAGMEAIRTGVVGGAQGAVKAEGTVGEKVTQGVKEGAEVGSTTGLVSGVLGTIGGAAEKAGITAGKAEKLSQTAQGAASKSDVAAKVKGKIDAAEQALHTQYESGIQDLYDRLSGTSISAQENPLAEKAKQILGEPIPGEHKVVAHATEAARADLKPDVRELLQELSTGEYKLPAEAGDETSALRKQLGFPGEEPKTKPHEPFTIGDLIGRPKNAENVDQPSLAGLRQRLREKAEQFEPGDINSRSLKRLLFDPVDQTSAMDDTIEKLAQQSGDTAALQDYRALRANYRTKIDAFDNPVITKLREGRADDAAKDFVALQRQGAALPNAGKVRNNVEQLRTILGDKGVKEFGSDVFHTIMKESMDGEQFNAGKFLETMERISPETKNELFDLNKAQSGTRALMKDAESVEKLQKLSKLGLITGIGSTVGFAHGGASVVTLAGLLVADRGMPKARQYLDYIATHPYVLKTYETAGKVATSPAGKAAGTAATKAAQAGVIFGGAAGPLGANRR